MTIEATLERIADALETLVARAAQPVAAEAKPAAKKASAPAKQDTSAQTAGSPSAATEAVPATSTTSTTATTAASPSEQAYDRETVKNLAMAYAGKAGPTLLAELFTKHGGNGKFNQVPEENIHLLGVEINDLLSQAA